LLVKPSPNPIPNPNLKLKPNPNPNLNPILNHSSIPVATSADQHIRRELWLFRPFASSPSGLFAPWLIRPLADSPPGFFAPWLVFPQARSPPGSYAPWFVRPWLISLPPDEYTNDSLLKLVFQFTERQQVSVASRH